MRIVLNILLFGLLNFSLFSQGFNRSYSINQGSTVLLNATVFFDGNIYASAAFFDTTQNLRIVNGLMKINYASGNIDTIVFERLPRHFSIRKKAMIKTMDSCIVVTGNIMTMKDTIVLYKYDSDSLLWYKTYADPNAMSFFSINILQSNDSAYYLLVNYQENSYDVNTMVMKLRSN
ncbi:MAG: hypothetical protein IAE67_10575, partial [Candidatus Competibacteraceae bacterium]|nr:hypothetical protein [Candidatus Competibacteraceae bacterium]